MKKLAGSLVEKKNLDLTEMAVEKRTPLDS